MYSILKADKTNVTEKTKSVVKKQIANKHHKKTILDMEQLWHGMNILRSEGHDIYGMHIIKVLLSAFF